MLAPFYSSSLNFTCSAFENHTVEIMEIHSHVFWPRFRERNGLTGLTKEITNSLIR